MSDRNAGKKPPVSVSERNKEALKIKNRLKDVDNKLHLLTHERAELLDMLADKFNIYIHD